MANIGTGEKSTCITNTIILCIPVLRMKTIWSYSAEGLGGPGIRQARGDTELAEISPAMPLLGDAGSQGVC